MARHSAGQQGIYPPCHNFSQLSFVQADLFSSALRCLTRCRGLFSRSCICSECVQVKTSIHVSVHALGASSNCNHSLDSLKMFSKFDIFSIPTLDEGTFSMVVTAAHPTSVAGPWPVIAGASLASVRMSNWALFGQAAPGSCHALAAEERPPEAPQCPRVTRAPQVTGASPASTLAEPPAVRMHNILTCSAPNNAGQIQHVQICRAPSCTQE